jgi:aryl-alcohol dehydrogenase-like predicted oxidoreductase
MYSMCALQVTACSAHFCTLMFQLQTFLICVSNFTEVFQNGGLLDTCEELGIGFVPWGPIGMGYLTESLTADVKLNPKSDLRSTFERFQPETIAANKPFVDRITRLAEKKKATTAQLSLAWLLAQKPFIVPIPGTGKVKHLQENVQAANLILTAEDLKEIDGALSDFKVHGGRMNTEQMQVVQQ